jgi:BON domain
MTGRDEDKLGGRSDALAGRGHGGGHGPIRRYRDEDQGEDPAAHFRRGDADAARRLAGADTGALRAASHRGRGPKGYRRSDERIREDVSDRLTEDSGVDASGIEVGVRDGEVTLSGTVGDRRARRRAEDLAESVAGVAHVQNNLRLGQAAPDRDRPPLYEGATSASALGGVDAGTGSAGVSGLAGGSAGAGAMGATEGRSGAAPGVTSTTGAGYSALTGTGRTGGPTAGGGAGQEDLAQPPAGPGR